MSLLCSLALRYLSTTRTSQSKVYALLHIIGIPDHRSLRNLTAFMTRTSLLGHASFAEILLFKERFLRLLQLVRTNRCWTIKHKTQPFHKNNEKGKKAVALHRSRQVGLEKQGRLLASAWPFVNDFMPTAV